MRAILLGILFAAAAPPGIAFSAEYAYPADRQRIYCAERIEYCFLYCESHMSCPQPDTMFVFIRANDSLGVRRAHFRLEIDYPCCDSVLAVIPGPNVTIEGGDILTGMTLSFPDRKSGHFEVLALALWRDARAPAPSMDDSYRVRNAWLERSSGEIVPVDDYWTFAFYPDCYFTSIIWLHPDTIDVSIGSKTDVKIQWGVDGPYYGGWYVNIADERSWILRYAPNSIWVTGCPTCLWHMETTHVDVSVPTDVPAGSLSTLFITRQQDGGLLESLVLRAVPPVGTQGQSWGGLKSIFK